MLRFISVVGLFLVLFTRSVYSEKFFKNFELVLGKTSTNAPATVSTAVSTPQCITDCLKEEICVAVVYHSTSQNCYLLNSAGSLVDTDDLEYSYIYVGGGCMNGWIEHNGSCYLFGDDHYSWAEAGAFCNNLGAELVEIETPTENVFITDTLTSLDYSKSWIGLNDIDHEGVWVWPSSGADAVYLGWHQSQPNQGIASNCAAIWKEHDFKWVDEWCTSQFHPICEQDATYVGN